MFRFDYFLAKIRPVFVRTSTRFFLGATTICDVGAVLVLASHRSVVKGAVMGAVIGS